MIIILGSSLWLSTWLSSWFDYVVWLRCLILCLPTLTELVDASISRPIVIFLGKCDGCQMKKFPGHAGAYADDHFSGRPIIWLPETRLHRLSRSPLHTSWHLQMMQLRQRRVALSLLSAMAWRTWTWVNRSCNVNWASSQTITANCTVKGHILLYGNNQR